MTPKYKKILLINPDDPGIFPNVALGYIQGSIKRIFEDSVSVISRDLNKSIELLKHEQFDLVGVSFHSFSVKQAKFIIDSIKYPTHLICGGHHPSALPEQMLELGFDQVVIGPGENSIIHVLLGETKKKVVETDDFSFFKSIDEIPFPDYSGQLGDWLNNESIFGMPIISSRGCPFSCNFCASSLFWDRNYFLRSTESVMSEIISNINNFGIKNWMFEDDNFTLNKQRTFDLCLKIKEENKCGKHNWQCASRAEVLNDKFLCESLLEAGCKKVWLGVESFSQKSLDRCKKNTKVEKMMSGISTAESLGLQTMCQFIVGLPGDTIEDIIETSNRIKEIKISNIGANIAWILPNTHIYEKAKQFGFNDDMFLNGDSLFYTYENSFEKLMNWCNIINNSKR